VAIEGTGRVTNKEDQNALLNGHNNVMFLSSKTRFLTAKKVVKIRIVIYNITKRLLLLLPYISPFFQYVIELR